MRNSQSLNRFVALRIQRYQPRMDFLGFERGYDSERGLSFTYEPDNVTKSGILYPLEQDYVPKRHISYPYPRGYVTESAISYPFEQENGGKRPVSYSYQLAGILKSRDDSIW